MASINLYRVDEDKKDLLIQELNSRMTPVKTKFIQSSINNSELGCTLYTSEQNKKQSDLSWKWLLDEFETTTVKLDARPKAVLLVEGENNCDYAVTFGSAYFLIDKFCDKDFGFSYAKRVDFDEIKTTTFTTPNSKRNKTVNTYVDYSDLDFDSGVSFAKLKVKLKLTSDFELFTPSVEIGTSIKFSARTESLCSVADIISHVEYILKQDEKHNIPLFLRVKDTDKIHKLEERLLNQIEEDSSVQISELDIVGANEIFNRNDNECVLKYGGKTQDVTSLTIDEIVKFCDKYGFDFSTSILDIKVIKLLEGEPVTTQRIKELIDYTDEEERCVLSKGIWYFYNDDYLDYLSDSISEIEAEYHPEYDFSSALHNAYIEDCVKKARIEKEFKNLNDDEIRSRLKSKLYAELVFNEFMERDFGFSNLDRQYENLDGQIVEPMDLYKDGVMYSVKIGGSSSKLSYAVEQSLSAMKLYKHNQLSGQPNIHTVALWLVLDRKTHIEVNGVPDLNKLNMLIFKNKLDEWKKEVRIQGLKPLVYINYRS